jgi:hypothetical protein
VHVVDLREKQLVCGFGVPASDYPSGPWSDPQITTMRHGSLSESGKDTLYELGQRYNLLVGNFDDAPLWGPEYHERVSQAYDESGSQVRATRTASVETCRGGCDRRRSAFCRRWRRLRRSSSPSTSSAKRRTVRARRRPRSGGGASDSTSNAKLLFL